MLCGFSASSARTLFARSSEFLGSNIISPLVYFQVFMELYLLLKLLVLCLVVLILGLHMALALPILMGMEVLTQFYAVLTPLHMVFSWNPHLIAV